MYITTADKFIITYQLCLDGTTSSHSVCLPTDRITYTHRANFDTHAEAEHLLARIEAAGEIDEHLWAQHRHGIYDTHVDHKGTEPCERCSGTGNYIVGVENGKYITKGICYRCEGKGKHTRADRCRNSKHDAHYMARA